MVQYRGHTIDAHMSGWFGAHVYLPNAGRYITIQAASIDGVRRMIDAALEEDSNG